ncbi:MAG: competence type IV pilus minor pilin ComGF [Sporolactobacillus sp.]
MKRAEGFSLLSMMLALFILSFVLIMAVSLEKVIVDRTLRPEKTIQDCFLFFAQTGKELHTAQSVHASASGRQLTLDKNGIQITYSWDTRHRIIRKVNGAGYEIVLFHVANVFFQCVQNQAWIEVTDDQGHHYNWQDQSYMDSKY